MAQAQQDLGRLRDVDEDGELLLPVPGRPDPYDMEQGLGPSQRPLAPAPWSNMGDATGQVTSFPTSFSFRSLFLEPLRF